MPDEEAWAALGRTLLASQLQVRGEGGVHSAFMSASGSLNRDDEELTADQVRKMYGELERAWVVVDYAAAVVDGVEPVPAGGELDAELIREELGLGDSHAGGSSDDRAGRAEVTAPFGETVVETAGGNEFFNPGTQQAEVQINAHSEGTTLKIRNDQMAARAMLLPEDIDTIVEKLLAAKEQLDEDEVEESREWIEPEYRSGDSDE